MYYINTNTTEAGLQIDVTGRVDALAAPRFGQQLMGYIAEGHTDLTLHLSGLEYMSSAGLRELVRAFKLAQMQGGELRVVQPSAWMLRVLQVTGLDTVVL